MCLIQINDDDDFAHHYFNLSGLKKSYRRSRFSVILVSKLSNTS